MNETTRPPLVVDPGLRHVLLITRRALLMICAAIMDVCSHEGGRKPP